MIRKSEHGQRPTKSQERKRPAPQPPSASAAVACPPGDPVLHAGMDETTTDLQALRLRYQEMIDFAPEGYVLTDAQGIIQEANYAASMLLHCRRDFLVGKPLAMFTTRSERGGLYQRLVQLHQHSGVAPRQTILQAFGGEPRHVLMTATFIRESKDHPAALRWLLRDITAAQQFQQSFLQQKALADSLADMVAAAVLVIDHSGRILRSNPYFRMLAGHQLGDLVGLNWCDFLPQEQDRTTARAMVARALAEDKGQTPALSFGKARPWHLLVWSAKNLGEDNGISRLVLLGYDITDLHQAQERALQAERLAAIGQMVAGLAHESRNALQRSQACIEMLRWRIQDRPEGLHLLERIEQAQEVLYRLYEEVRQFAAPLKLERRFCGLAQVWREAWADLEMVRRDRDAELREGNECPDLESHVSPFHLKQLFRNLFDNALSAARDPVAVTVLCKQEVLDGRDAVQITVRDNGPGFAAEQRQRLFEPFFTTKTHGTGLGLAICKRIVEAHGGTIRAEAASQGGAEFIITLPRSAP